MSSFGKNIYTLKIIQKKLQKYFKRNYKNNRKEIIRKVWRLNEDGERLKKQYNIVRKSSSYSLRTMVQ